nr:hypothetical protein [Acidobacteriota bacterium]
MTTNSSIETQDLLRRELRANPAYELVLFDRLDASLRRELSALEGDPDLYGVLRPRPGSGLTVLAVCRETALLFLTLRETGPLPAYVRALYGEATAREVAQLIADGVLEVAAGGAF